MGDRCRRNLERDTMTHIKYGSPTCTNRSWTMPLIGSSIRCGSIGNGATSISRVISASESPPMPQSKFQPQQAVDLAEAFRRRGVDYLFVGKSGAILLGYPAITQDVDLHLPKNAENGHKVAAALEELGFVLGPELKDALVAGKDLVQIKSGPFDVDLIRAPRRDRELRSEQGALDSARWFPGRLARRHHREQARQRPRKGPDRPSPPRAVREEYERRYPRPLRSRAEIARRDATGGVSDARP